MFLKAKNYQGVDTLINMDFVTKIHITSEGKYLAYMQNDPRHYILYKNNESSIDDILTDSHTVLQQ